MQWNHGTLRNLGLGLALLGAGAAAAETASQGAVAPQTSLAGELRSLTSRAALVFSGQVVAIDRRAGVVRITFRVEQPVVGAVGASYILREWAGLWPPGQFRYHVGERALVFVRGVSAAGFASPVDGQEGVVPVLVEGADAPALVDIRRLAAALQRAPGTPLPSESDGAIQFSDALAVITAAAGSEATPSRPEPARFPLNSHKSLLQAPSLGEASSPVPVTADRIPPSHRAIVSSRTGVAYATH